MAFRNPMRTYEVRVVVNGKNITDTVQATSYQDAKAIMEARYPNGSVQSPKDVTKE